MLRIVVHMSGNYNKPCKPRGNCRNPLILPPIRLIIPNLVKYLIYGDLLIVETSMNASSDQKEHVLWVYL